MSDNENDDFLKNYTKEFGKAAVSDGIQKAGNKAFDKVKSTYRLKTFKKLISKTSGLLKGFLGGVLNFGETAYTFAKHGVSKEFAGSLGSSIGSILAAGAASSVLGSFFPGVGNIVGFIVGAGAAAIGSIGGEFIGNAVYDRITDMKNGEYRDDEYNKYHPSYNGNDDDNLTGGGETGGIEFEIPKEINGFKKLLFFNKYENQCLIFKNEFSNINEIIEIANRFIISDNIKFNSVNQVFQTILSEIYGGFIGEGILPYVSLNFNNKALLYSIMPNYYKKTLVGNILGYLDYFLKGFVNGGFFKEEFASKWYINQNENSDYLNTNFINLKKYIYINKNNIKNHELYLTVYDLGENISEINQFHKNSLSAFRIIGTIEDDILVNNNIIIPSCSFRTESDFNLFPGYFSNGNNNDSKELAKTQEAIKCMKGIINIIMPQIPHFRGYFNLLDMITFSIHYISTLDSNAKYPDFSESLLFKANNKSYVSILPPIFPPLPIKRQVIIDVIYRFHM